MGAGGLAIASITLWEMAMRTEGLPLVTQDARLPASRLVETVW